MKNKFWKMMDQVFLFLITISGEEKKDKVSINHIL